MMTFIPVGGLANRMRSIHSAISLCENDALQIYWFKDQGLNCRFEHLFHPIPLPHVTLKEANFWNKVLYDRPRRKNLYIPKLYQKLCFDARLYENKTKEGELDYQQWKRNHNSVYLASYNQFYPPTKSLKDLFIPIEPIQDKIENICSVYTMHTIGIHIRRGDHNVAIRKSPIELFIVAMEKEIEKEPLTNFYLATDSETEKAILIKKFGSRIITSKGAATRNTTEGIQDAVVDLYALSRTHKILGSFYSSFSEIAAQLGSCELQILTL
jgi:hypothetical protein